MDLVKDNRSTDILYTDKANTHIATNDEVIKLINADGNRIMLFIDIICNCNNLNDNDRSLLYIIFETDNNSISVQELANKFRIVTSKSASTFTRSLFNLQDKNVICVKNNYAYICDRYNVHRDKIAKCKYIVIETDYNDTSELINIF